MAVTEFITGSESEQLRKLCAFVVTSVADGAGEGEIELDEPELVLQPNVRCGGHVSH